MPSCILILCVLSPPQFLQDLYTLYINITVKQLFDSTSSYYIENWLFPKCYGYSCMIWRTS